MQDVAYYMRAFETKKRILEGERNENFAKLYESFISKESTVFEVETTNVCNMKCVMCPKTKLMKRKQGHMKPEVYNKIIDQIKPLATIERLKWKQFCDLKLSKSKIMQEDEDFFHFVISADVLTLQGFGEPLLDPYIVDRIKTARKKGISVYFSCNPTNMTDKLLKELLDARVNYIKYSIDGLDNETLEKYRGVKVDIKEIYAIVNKTIEMIKKGNYPTILVLTMLKFGNNIEQTKKFMEDWKGKDVFVYIKNSHNRWLYNENETPDNTSHHIRTYCEYPFMSMSIWQDGTVVPCSLDFDGALAMGNINDKSLKEIWNSEKYKEFRRRHITGDFPKGHICKVCDLPILGDVVNNKT